MVKSTFNWALDQLDGTGTVGSYDAAKDPIVLLNFVGQIQILIADPAVLQDMFSAKNQLVDKTDMLRIMFKNFYGDSFLFSKTDDNWRAKRKATSHAFYRERMVNMLEVLKEKIGQACEKWAKSIDESRDNFVTIDIAYEIRKVFARNIIHIAFGEDIEEEKFELHMRGDLQANTFVKKRVSMSDAISETFDQTLITIRDKAIDPLYLPFYYLTGKTIALTSKLRQIDANCRAVRHVIHEFIEKRRSGVKQSSVAANADLLSLFMANPTEFPDDVIVDEIMDFFVAGAQTTQLTTETIIGHFATDPESLQEVRQEFEEKIGS